MKQKIYMLVGVPGSGKTWVTDRVKDRFTFIHHDGYIGHINQPEAYVSAILEAAEDSQKPILIEAPFSMSQIMDPLKSEGFHVEPVFILEPHHVVAERYFKRENREIPKGHLTRMNTYAQRARGMGGFAGTSEQVLNHLKSI